MAIFKNETERAIVNNILTSIVFSRGGIIPSIELSREDYLKDMLNTCKKQAKYYTNLILNTNKKTKKYQDYINKLKKTYINIVNICILLAR